MPEQPYQPWIDQFFAALALRQVAECEQQLAALQAAALTMPTAAPWCAYLQGILSNERDQDWAAAERIFQSLLADATLEQPLQGKVLLALGLTYEYQARWRDAIACYEASLPIFVALQQPLDQARVYKNIAIAYWEGVTQGDLAPALQPNAITACQTALTLLNADGEPLSDAALWLKGSILNTLGTNYMHLARWDNAIACYEQDLAICRQLDDRFGMGLSYNNLGEVYQRAGPAHWPQAEAAYQEALAVVRAFGNLYEESDILTNLASLYQQMGQPDAALTCYQAALVHVESLRARISADDARAGFFTTVTDLYAQTVAGLLANDQVAEAFDMVERARSRTFVELLAQSKQVTQAPLRPALQTPPALATQEQQLRTTLQQLYQTTAPSGTTADLAVQQNVEAQLAAVLRQLRLFDQAYVDLQTVVPLTHQQVQTRLPTDVALLAYFTSAEAIWAFVVTQTTMTATCLPLTRSALQLVFGTRRFLQRLMPGPDGGLAKPWSLTKLYELLVAPCRAAFHHCRRLVILPHDTLHYLPFHALYNDQSGRTLADDFTLFYAPSATVLLDYCQRPPQSEAAGLLAFGYNHTDLRHAEAEAVVIAGLTQGVALTGAAATSHAVFQQAAGYRWLHFSCHGVFMPHAPLTSALYLADGPLYAADIFSRLRVQAELITLSACETGISQVLRGDELLGLVRAFIYAGAPSVVVSLWPVNEIATRLLMEAFYGYLLAGMGKAAALQAAQQWLRTLTKTAVVARLTAAGESDSIDQIARLHAMTGQEQLFDHPYFWAPFMLVGDQL